MLYREAVTYKGDTESETYIFIVDINVEDAIPVDNDEQSSTYELATLDNTSLDELRSAIDSRLEGENHHREMAFPDLVVEHVTIVAGEEVAKAVLWSMIEDKGLSLGL